jgi:hypothetical protein
MLNMPSNLRKTFFTMVCIGEQFWSKNYSAFNLINKNSKVNKKDLKELIDFLNLTAKTGTKGIDKIERTAKQIFLERGYLLEGNFWDQVQYLYNKDFNYLKNESKHETHKIPVESCCDAFLNIRLNDLSVGFRYIDPYNIVEPCAEYEEKLGRLNRKVEYQLEETEDYDLPDYDILQEARKMGLGLWQGHMIDYSFIQDQAWRKYLINSEHLFAEINNYRKFL